MGYIYKITNDINDKVYIGKTCRSIEQRFKEHCRDAYRHSERPLYRAMNKYGNENFHISIIGEYPDQELEKQEIYWIGYYHSYENGYNATQGGDGSLIFDHQAILEALKENPYPALVAKQFNCSADLVINLAKDNNMSIKNYGNDIFRSNSKIVYQYTKQGEYINEFPSTVEAAKWCATNKKCSSLTSGVRSHISDCANGKRKSAYGYIWRYKKL